MRELYLYLEIQDDFKILLITGGHSSIETGLGNFYL